MVNQRIVKNKKRNLRNDVFSQGLETGKQGAQIIVTAPELTKEYRNTLSVNATDIDSLRSPAARGYVYSACHRLHEAISESDLMYALW